jgi:hypothetical protein
MPLAASDAIEAGAAALAAMQEADGGFPLEPVASQPPGGPADNLFATATVLGVAAAFLPDDIVSRAAAYILRRRNRQGLWSWDADGVLPVDSDDTAICMGALVRAGVTMDAGKDARLLRSFWRWGGPFRTWRARGYWNRRDRDDAVVNCNVLWALTSLGAPLRPREVRAVGALVAAQRGPSRYYCSQASVAWAAARVGLDALSLRTPDEADLAGRPLECALWGLAGKVGSEAAAGLLLAIRRSDGGWTAEPWVRDHLGAWESRAVTTAFAVAALARLAGDSSKPR